MKSTNAKSSNGAVEKGWITAAVLEQDQEVFGTIHTTNMNLQAYGGFQSQEPHGIIFEDQEERNGGDFGNKAHLHLSPWCGLW